MTDRDYMLRAIYLAQKGIGAVDPNPLVGAVIVKNGKIIGEGFHAVYGGLHAERDALKNLTESAEGSTLYVTLEPCCHHGKQPPCTDAIIENKIAKVVIGSRDPNPIVSGRGAEMLRKNGVVVEEDFMKDECDALNPVFFHYITTGTPYVVMKYAMTADGKISTRTGESKWISGAESRDLVQKMRYTYAGIMAGIGTVLADDPMLNVRLEGKRSPVRIICDSRLRIPLSSKIVKTAGEYKTIIACALSEDELSSDPALREKKTALESSGAEVVHVPGENGRVDLYSLMLILGAKKISGILLEGGGTLNYSALKSGIVNEVRAFIAPKIFGGAAAKTPVEGFGIEHPSNAFSLQLYETAYAGDDIILSYKVLRRKC